jgi:transposase
VPLAAILTAANVPDVKLLMALLDAVPPVRGKRGAPRFKPESVQADRGYDSEAVRQALRERGIKSLIAKRNTMHGSGLGKTRWVVERTLAWLRQLRRLRVRYERRADVHEAFLSLGCALICWKIVQRSFC